MSKEKILIWDIETSLNLVTTFTLFPKSIPHTAIKKDWYIIMGSWKWFGEDKIHHVNVLGHKNKQLDNDYHVVKKLQQITEQADILIHHNGDKFDLKKLNARILYHRLPPFTKKPITIDTYKQAKKHFGFTSNRLDYIGRFLKVGNKLTTAPFLWDKVLEGDKKAIKEMQKYCDQDVQLLEDIYNELAPYITHPNTYKQITDELICTNTACRSSNVIKRGVRPTIAGVFKQEYQCKDCGAYSTARCKDDHIVSSKLKS